MDRSQNLLDTINDKLAELNKAERKVAEVILASPEQATRFSIAALAQAAGVSEPTVNRFCRSFAIQGYPELKIQLAQSLASGATYVSRAVEPDDTAEEYTKKIFATTIASLESAMQGTDSKLISKAVDLLIQARHIHFFGLGASASVALDAQHKFFRFNLAVSAQVDVLMQRMITAVAHTGDVFVIISYTGRTKDLIDVAREARSNGASVIGITATDSPLAKLCSVCVGTPDQEDTDIYMPMTSRLIQLTMLDVLATGVTLRRGSDFQPHLRKIKESLLPTRLQPGSEDDDSASD
ncbi:transcriptional regulator HexR [Atopomonas sediminilitoris]|uniref:transcriptional regulator HexR n=1 Tax=Atopomonas sediminilitoris TaxID=2919919 RepID=UPI001F4E4EC1|nr:transcriptional regulator HexR [Atopomonas sediminilitoris]MCJ8169223.1 transcriptional regulator HexR [Atopomonas sediminilitoris]